MAEYCVDCWNEINNENLSKHKYIRTFETELCEGCGKYKRAIIKKANVLDYLMRPIDFVLYVCFGVTERLYEFYCGKKDDKNR